MLRPPFLAVTVAGYVLGVACARNAEAVRPMPWALLAAGLLVAVCAHAAANVLNDYEDHRNGSDAANREAIAPFTGGAGFIQRGEASPAGTRILAWSLGLASMVGGLAIAMLANPWLLGVGAAGLLVGWAYSAPPLALMARGLGEPAIALAWTLVVVGAALLATGTIPRLAPWLGVAHGLLVTAILLVNSFPDARADAGAGKATLRVRWGPARTAWLYAACVIAAHGISLLAALATRQPLLLLAQATLPAALWASLGLWRDREAPAALQPAIVATIGVAVVHTLLLAVALALAPGAQAAA